MQILSLTNVDRYAFDVIGELFFGKKFGFLDERQDWGTYIKTLDILLPIFVMVGPNNISFDY